MLINRIGLGISILATSAVLLSGVATTTSAASDRKVYPASMCTSGDEFNDIVYTWNGRAESDRSTSRNIHCPIVRDTTWGSKLQGAWVHVVDRNPVSSVWCRVASSDVDGYGGSLGSTVYSGASFNSSAVVTLTMGDPSWAIDFGQYWMQCNVPAMYNGARASVRRPLRAGVTEGQPSGSRRVSDHDVSSEHRA